MLDLNKNPSTINSIIKGNVFEMIDLNYTELIGDNCDIKKKISMLKKEYEFKKDALEKTMEYYKSFLEEYFIQKINEIENNNDLNEINEDYIFNDLKIEYEDLSNKLNMLYKNKKEKMEYNFQLFLKNFSSHQ